MTDEHDPHTLTSLELEIMRALWDSAPATVRQIQEHPVVSSRELAYNTVQTMLNILVRKKKARRHREGKAFLYKPILSRGQAARAALGDVVDRLFEGNAERLVLSLVESRRLSPESLAELQALVEGEVTDADD